MLYNIGRGRSLRFSWPQRPDSHGRSHVLLEVKQVRRRKKKQVRVGKEPPSYATSLIRAIGIRLVAEWVRELVVSWLANHDQFL
jgi:hypothetical protein